MAISESLRRGAAALVLIWVAGCGAGGPELGKVHGTVKLDGQPLDGATVYFAPSAGGRPSIGRTDVDGHYELLYTEKRRGALLGEHVVRINTGRRGNPDDGIAPVPEKVPTKYNTQSELKRTVESGKNPIDFELDSKGKIVQQRDG
jgi:hypothetical protein